MEAANKTVSELHDESTAELEASIANIEEINRKVRANLDKDKAEEDARAYQDQYNELTKKIEGVRDQKTELLNAADLPLPELSVKEGELIYKGQQWDNMSGSDRLKVSTAIVRKLNPKCGFVLLDKLEQMDLVTLNEFGQWLEQEGLQAIATRVSTGDECSIIIEDGYVVKDLEAGKAEAPAEAVPDNLVADRLDSAGYSLALDMDEKSIRLLEKTSGVNVCATKTAATEETAYKEVLAAKTYLTRKGVPTEGRWMICSPEFMATLMMDDHFIRQGDLSQQMKNAGATGSIAGFALFESGNTMFEDTKIVASKKTTTEFIAGHPNWCHRVQDWSVAVHAQDLSGSGKYIGASAVQGRKIFGMKISKPQTVYVKRTEVAAEEVAAEEVDPKCM